MPICGHSLVETLDVTCEPRDDAPPAHGAELTGLVVPMPPRAVSTARSAGAWTAICSAVHSRRAHRLHACEGQVAPGGLFGR